MVDIITKQPLVRPACWIWVTICKVYKVFSLLFEDRLVPLVPLGVHLIILCQLRFKPWHELIYTDLCRNGCVHFWPNAKTTYFKHVLKMINVWEKKFMLSTSVTLNSLYILRMQGDEALLFKCFLWTHLLFFL